MFDALQLDDVDQEDDEAENTEGNGERYAGVFQHVHAFVSINTCIGPDTNNVHVADSRSNHKYTHDKYTSSLHISFITNSHLPEIASSKTS